MSCLPSEQRLAVVLVVEGEKGVRQSSRGLDAKPRRLRGIAPVAATSGFFWSASTTSASRTGSANVARALGAGVAGPCAAALAAVAIASSAARAEVEILCVITGLASKGSGPEPGPEGREIPPPLERGETGCQIRSGVWRAENACRGTSRDVRDVGKSAAVSVVSVVTGLLKSTRGEGGTATDETSAVSARWIDGWHRLGVPAPQHETAPIERADASVPIAEQHGPTHHARPAARPAITRTIGRSLCSRIGGQSRALPGSVHDTRVSVRIIPGVRPGQRGKGAGEAQELSNLPLGRAELLRASEEIGRVDRVPVAP